MPPPGTLEPTDDGAADHLLGRRLPAMTLRSTDGQDVRITEVTTRRWVLFLYPLTGRPDVDLPRGWHETRGAQGCTAEACGFRDSFADLVALGVECVFGASSNAADYQSEVASRLHLPYALLSDPQHELARALGLPTFEAGGMRLYKRLTMTLRGTRIEHVFYPVHPPESHASLMIDWLRTHPVRGISAGSAGRRRPRVLSDASRRRLPHLPRVAGRGGPPTLIHDSDVVARNDLVVGAVCSFSYPENPGHVIVVPTAHYRNLYEMPRDALHASIDMAKAVALAMKRQYVCDGITLRQNNEPAGKPVRHPLSPPRLPALPRRWVR